MACPMTHPKLLEKFNCESKGENNGRIRSWGMLPVSQHFGGRGACWSSKMGTRMNDKSIIHIDLHRLNNKLVSV
jgi:hypothetical protein